jgi:hypothetical protein
MNCTVNVSAVVPKAREILLTTSRSSGVRVCSRCCVVGGDGVTPPMIAICVPSSAEGRASGLLLRCADRYCARNRTENRPSTGDN